MSVILNFLPAQPATNTFYDNIEVADPGENWQLSGVTVVYGPCAVPTVVGMVACADDDVVFDYASVSANDSKSRNFQTFNGFRLRELLTCNPVGYVDDRQAFFDTLRVAFNASSHVSMASSFWSGGTDWDGLVSLTPDVVSPMTISKAFGYLSKKMASTGFGSGGTFHMTPTVAEVAAKHNLVYRRGQKLYTVVGDFLVVTDGGYTGAGPTLLDPAQPATSTREWIYATGPVYYHVGQLQFAAGFDITKYVNRQSNRLIVPVEADGVFYFDPCSFFGVPVDLTGE
jgi:hypothetical protein